MKSIYLVNPGPVCTLNGWDPWSNLLTKHFYYQLLKTGNRKLNFKTIYMIKSKVYHND